ncbi:hypothetical protein Stube_42340 [Streptomyces tubercidicus]|uniref:Uncharacterized protein n=1 Tax=Streptomyces tubercidicus TaxID=47759 RepID=A0A640UXU0_9ACTN|nr:hypothetical protein Stube_42340 [Streptomyces tubercidicus]
MPPATGTAAGMAVSAATASSSESGNVTVCDACGACVVKPAAPSPVSRQFRSAVRYVLPARTWQLWHIFPDPRREGPRSDDPSPNRLLVRFRPPPTVRNYGAVRRRRRPSGASGGAHPGVCGGGAAR